MSWKDEIQIRDLDPEQVLEMTCKSCGHVHHYDAADLQEKQDLFSLKLSEVEERERCRSWGCSGKVRLSIYHDNSHSGFVGGLA
ncbi:MAG: hypothetical protein AAF228_14055 [Pseudomonadota bacterium]